MFKEIQSMFNVIDPKSVDANLKKLSKIEPSPERRQSQFALAFSSIKKEESDSLSTSSLSSEQSKNSDFKSKSIPEKKLSSKKAKVEVRKAPETKPSVLNLSEISQIKEENSMASSSLESRVDLEIKPPVPSGNITTLNVPKAVAKEDSLY